MMCCSFQVCERIYSERRAFDKILSCYWTDPIRRDLVFEYIEEIWRRADVTDAERVLVKQEAMRNVEVTTPNLQVLLNDVIAA